MFPTRLLLQKLYKAKKPWPPDFTLLSPRHQFRLERRYRRRAKLKWARPGLQKFVKLAQAGSTIFVIVYGVLWADWGNDHLFVPIRNWVSEWRNSFWTTPSPPRPAFKTSAEVEAERR